MKHDVTTAIFDGARRGEHPGSFTITQNINNAQQITQITSSISDANNPGTLVQSLSYTPFGALKTFVNRCVGAGCVQRQESYDYNNRLQPVRIQLGTSATPNANHCWVYNYYTSLTNLQCYLTGEGTVCFQLTSFIFVENPYINCLLGGCSPPIDFCKIQ